MKTFSRNQLTQAVRFKNSDPDTECEILDVERKLCVRFPEIYREILLIDGEAQMGPIRTAVDGDLHFGFLTMKRERFEYVSATITSVHHRLQKSQGDMRRIIPFGAIGNGDHICFDYRSTSIPAIVLWSHEVAFSSFNPLSAVAQSFDELMEIALLSAAFKE